MPPTAFLRAAGRDLPLDLERVDEGAALEREEKTGGGERVRQRQTADGVPAAVEGAAEAGDGLEVHAAQGDVGGQKDRLAARPGVIGAAVRKGAQVLRRVDVDDVILSGSERGQGQERLSTSDRASASRREERLFGFIVCTSFLDHAAGNDGHVHIAVHDRADHAADRAVDLAVHHAVEPDASVRRVAVNDVRHGE